MQNVGQQYGQGAAPPHHGAPFGHPETASNTGGSITSSLRQFRKKDVDKQQVNENHSSTTESHVARVAPHNHYPPRPAENYRYQTQFPDYSVPQPVKYSEISELHPLQEQPPQSVIQKPKGKDYMEMCNVQQGHMNHLGGQQPAYAPDANLHGHVQYQPPKDHQVHTVFKPESQYFPKDAQYQPMPHQIPKYSMPPGHAQVRKYPSENDFLSQLRRLNPSMARSIMSEHQMQESQPYQSMDQNRMYQNQRYMNYPSGLQGSPYSSHGYMPPQNYGNYPPSCSYTRPPQMAPRFPAMNPHERSMSPRRRYSDNLPINSMNYGGLPQKISPNYPQYNAPEYAQHYQHRRTLPEYYQQPCRSAQYLSHQINPQEIPESRVTVSDSIKQYIENWADEETASEMNQIETNRLIKETIRVRDDQSTETVYMINASELQYLENGIPIVTSENIPLVTSENGQYIIKSGVSIDNSTGMVRIMEKTNPIDPENGGERVVNLHIMDPFKPDCMLASKPNDPNQRQEEVPYEKPKVVIHQNTVIHPSNQKITIREAENEEVHNKIGSSLPIIDGESPHDPLEKFEESIFKECKKETADKNCSPINMEEFDDFKDNLVQTSVICATGSTESPENKVPEAADEEKIKNMPIIDMREEITFKVEEATHAETESRHDLNSEDTKQSDQEDNENVDESEQTCESPDLSENRTKQTDEVADEQFSVIENTRRETTKETQDNSKDTTEEMACFDKPITTQDLVTENESATYEKMQVDECKHDPVENRGTTDDKGKEILESDATVAQTERCLTEESKKESSKSPYEASEANHSEETGDPTLSSIDISKRARRFFSVDDIINNIGTNVTKIKSDKERIERRKSIQCTREFLDKEIHHSKIFCLRAEDKVPTDLDTKKEIEEEADDNKEENVSQVAQQVENPSNTIEIRGSGCDKEKELCQIDENLLIAEQEMTVDGNEGGKEEELCQIVKEQFPLEEIKGHGTEDGKEVNTCEMQEPQAVVYVQNAKEQTESTLKEELEISNLYEEKTDCTKSNKVDVTNVPKEHGSPECNVTINEPSFSERHDAFMKCEDLLIVQKECDDSRTDFTSSQNEVHYRNAIRIEENNVLLEIAGELVEISVTSSNGKKVITVVPLSETTVVDFNDNYDTTESADINEQTKIEQVENDHCEVEVISTEALLPETEVIESTSEIIIGMDISLEEEIQLDLERPVLFTKAAKKAYENDLQNPSITTSEDINEASKNVSYTINDKVSSSKEQRKNKERNGKKRSENPTKKCREEPKHSTTLTETCSEIDDKPVEDSAVRISSKEEPKNDIEDFIPFKELLKARNLKKLKLQQKNTENVSADSTNKIENEEEVNDNKQNVKDQKKGDDETNKCEAVVSVVKPKNHKLRNYRKSSKIGEKKCDSREKTTEGEDKSVSEFAADTNSVNSSTIEGNVERIKEQAEKWIIFKDDFKKPEQIIEKKNTEVKSPKFEDPRLKRKSSEIIAPSVSEILKENSGIENSKRKLSLEEYKKKRKLSVTTAQDDKEKEAKRKKIDGEKRHAEKIFFIQRPKSLDDLKLPPKPKDRVPAKRKFSLEESYFKPTHLDWEETQSPKINTNTSKKSEKRPSEFSGLIDDNKSRNVIDLNTKPVTAEKSENSEDEMLQIYKEQVESKLNSINLQIPRVAKAAVFSPFPKPEANGLMDRFLKNEKITLEEMDKIKKIISYKRLVQQLNKLKSPDSTNPSYEIHRNADKDMKLHLKKVPEEKKKKRFMNLYAGSTSESDSDLSERKAPAGGAYSVVQSGCYAAGVPKLIIKRKTEMPVPVVVLERLDLGLIYEKKRKIF